MGRGLLGSYELYINRIFSLLQELQEFKYGGVRFESGASTFYMSLRKCYWAL